MTPNLSNFEFEAPPNTFKNDQKMPKKNYDVKIVSESARNSKRSNETGYEKIEDFINPSNELLKNIADMNAQDKLDIEKFKKVFDYGSFNPLNKSIL